MRTWTVVLLLLDRDGLGRVCCREAGVVKEVTNGGLDFGGGHEEAVEAADAEEVGGAGQAGAGDGDGAVVVAFEQWVIAAVGSAAAGDNAKRECGNWECCCDAVFAGG